MKEEQKKHNIRKKKDPCCEVVSIPGVGMTSFSKNHGMLSTLPIPNNKMVNY